MRVYLGLRHFHLNSKNGEISWVGNKADVNASYVTFGTWEGAIEKFDVIILAVGFGLEVQHRKFPPNSYWRNETHGQPILNGIQQSYVVSGFGDGALIDLCRLTIERYRQDTVLNDIFGAELEIIEDYFRENWTSKTPKENVFSFFTSIQADVLAKGINSLSQRIRKDTRVLLHLSGRDGKVKSFPTIFGASSSFLNRMLLFMLYRCGAFHISFSNLEVAARQHGAISLNVLCRHGVNVMRHLQDIIVDFDTVEERLKAMQRHSGQEATELWEPGFFPSYV